MGTLLWLQAREVSKMRRPLIMTKEGHVGPARVKVSADKSYTADELRGLMSEFFKEAEIGVKESLEQRIVMLTFFSWLDDKEEQ